MSISSSISPIEPVKQGSSTKSSSSTAVRFAGTNSHKSSARMGATRLSGYGALKPVVAKVATARKRVDMIFTDLAVMAVTGEGLLLKEIYPGLGPEDIQSITEPVLIVSPDLKEISRYCQRKNKIGS